MTTSDSEQKPKPQNLKKMELVRLAFELGFIIALPIVAFGSAGKWLDERTGTYPFLTLTGIVAAITSTSFWMYRKFKGYFKNSAGDPSRPSATLPTPGEGGKERIRDS